MLLTKIIPDTSRSVAKSAVTLAETDSANSTNSTTPRSLFGSASHISTRFVAWVGFIRLDIAIYMPKKQKTSSMVVTLYQKCLERDEVHDVTFF